MAERNPERGPDPVPRSGSEESRLEGERALESGTVGRGLTSADSTEAPLPAEAADSDDRTLGGPSGGPNPDR